MIPPQLLLARSSPGWLLLILQLQWLLQALGRRLGAPGRACLPAPTLLLRLPLGTRADARSWRHAGGYQHCRGSQKQQSGSQRCLGPAARHMGRLRGCWPPLFRVPGLPGLPPARSKASSRHQHQRSAAWGATDLPTALPLACSAVRSGRCCRSGEGRPGGLEVGLHAAPAVEHWKADQFACRSSGEARSIRAAAMAGTAAASGERRQAAAAVGGHASRAASSALTSTYSSLRLLIEHPR